MIMNFEVPKGTCSAKHSNARVFGGKLTELAMNTEDKSVSMTIGNTEVIVFPERTNGGEYPDLYQITVKEADTGKWLLDTGNIHIEELEAVIEDFAEFDNNIQKLAGMDAGNYLRKTVEDNNKELE